MTQPYPRVGVGDTGAVDAAVVHRHAGPPEAGGLTSRELLAVLRSLAGLNLVGADLVGADLVGADIVEVTPANDHAQITGIAAAHLGYELRSALAVRKDAP